MNCRTCIWVVIAAIIKNKFVCKIMLSGKNIAKPYTIAIPRIYTPVASKLGVALWATRLPLLCVPRIAMLSAASLVDWAPSGLP